MSADQKITKNLIEKHSIHIILFLLLIYFIYNNLHLGFLLLLLIIGFSYYTNLRTFLVTHLSNYHTLFNNEETPPTNEETNDEEEINDYVPDVNEDDETNEILRTIHEELSK
jgi:hypothetical protein